ncbi:MAG: family 78 glycoside hydrolase catalytic domain [Prevotella sp.]|nr:family 78 glycoside hydrolase catalytic domain [Prevotella sp.]
MNRKLTLLLALVPLVALAVQHRAQTRSQQAVEVTNLRVENLSRPLGIDTAKPRFSWQIMSNQQDVRQTAYQIVVSDDKGEVWNTGKVESDQQLWVRYAGRKLLSNSACTWKVKVWTTAGETAWSSEECFSIGLLDEGKWSGYWIGLEQLMPGEERGFHTRMAARYLRKEFELKQGKQVRRATAYVAGIGLHEFYVNGQRMGNRVLTPVPSDYRKSIYYNTYDVTSALSPRLCLGIVLGNGRLFPMQQHKPYKIHTFGYPKCRVNVVVEYTDGTTQRLQTDDKGWRVTTDGPIRANNEYDGEEYDARKELTGWASVGYDDSSWMKAERTDIPQAYLRAQMTEGMTATPLSDLGTGNVPQQVRTLSPHDNIVDVGQNIAGWLKVRMRGDKGDTIRIVYAEKLNADGTLYRENFRNARSTDIYVCNGQEGKTGRWWTPTFVYHGFRYAQVIGLKHATNDDFIAEVVADEMAPIGRFECSDTLLNKVIRNAWWGILDNYKGMPVDCPQRDERQPWLGDRTMGSLGESFIFDNERLYTKWMRDICEAQRTDGCIPDVAPAFWNYYSDDVAWAAALPFTCDMLYRQYGNREAIDRSYPYIKKWVLHIIEEYGIDGIIHCGKYADWCVPPEKLELIHSQDEARKTDVTLISTAYIIRTLQLMEQWGCEADYWKPIREQMMAAFNKHFLTVKAGTSKAPGHPLYPDSIFYGNNTATANLLALSFGIVPTQYRAEVTKNVVENIILKNDAHVPCGVIGISWLLRGLSEGGFSDIAYMIATQHSYPSWGYMAENGATTIWELWNGDKASPKMNSGNHVMLLGDLVTWCYQYLGGIRQTGNAYKHIVLKPDFSIQDCPWANVSYDSPYGTITSSWKKTLQHVEWDVQIPCNTTADLCLPDGTIKTIGSGKYHFSCNIPTASPAITKDEFLYEQASFPQCHAATIVETKKGDLVATYFGGKHERNPDVCIWVSIKKKGTNEWSKPILAADGVFNLGTKNAEIAGITAESTPASEGPVRKGTASADQRRKACWNPVITEMPNGELWLFFKVGLKVSDWTGWVCKSKDGGKTWSDKEPLPKGFLGPIKNKPEIINGRLLCPSSTEDNGWKFHMEIYDIAKKEWKYVGPIKAELAMRTEDMKATNGSATSKKEDIEAPDAGGVATKDGRHPIDCIQPSILKLKDGRLQVLMRTRNGKIGTSFSSDNGNTWTNVTLLDVPNNQSGTDAVTLQDGRHVLIYNNFASLPGTKKGVRTPLSIAISDDGTHWQHALTLEDSPISQYSYPSIIQGKDGKLHAIYTWRRLRVAYKEIDPAQLP